MIWAPHGHNEGVTALAELTDAHLLDSDDGTDTTEKFARARELLRSSYVVDLAWLRTTPWRERLASSFDPPRRRRALGEITGVAIRHRVGASASALLLAGWISSRLGWDASPLSESVGGVFEGTAGADGGTITIRIEP